MSRYTRDDMDRLAGDCCDEAERCADDPHDLGVIIVTAYDLGAAALGGLIGMGLAIEERETNGNGGGENA